MLDEYKRERCALALSRAAHEIGLHQLTVTQIVKRARIGRSTFYDLFDGQEGAIRYACELGNRRLLEPIEASKARPEPWEERVRAAIDGLVDAACKEPHLIALCLTFGSGTDDKAWPHDPALVEALASLLAEGRGEPGGQEPGPRTEELLAHGILALVGERLRRDEAEVLPALAGEIAETATRRYLGQRAASG